MTWRVSYFLCAAGENIRNSLSSSHIGPSWLLVSLRNGFRRIRDEETATNSQLFKNIVAKTFQQIVLTLNPSFHFVKTTNLCPRNQIIVLTMSELSDQKSDDIPMFSGEIRFHEFKFERRQEAMAITDNICHCHSIAPCWAETFRTIYREPGASGRNSVNSRRRFLAQSMLL